MLNKEDLAYKLTADVFRNYELEELESKYNLYGGKLTAKIYNEILEELNIPDNTFEPVVFTGENEIPD